MNKRAETATSVVTNHHRRRRTAPVVLWAGLALLVCGGTASEIVYSDCYDHTMKKFYIENISIDGGSLRIQPVSLDPKVKNFGFTINGLPSADGVAHLPGTIEPKSYAFHAVITPEGSDAGETLDFTFYPAQLYEQKGRKSEGSYIIVHRATVPTHKPAYVYRAPTFPAEDQAFARLTWGGLKTVPMTDVALAQAIEEDIMLKLESHRGIPSDVMNVSSPRVQYDRALSGRDRVWCGDLAVIFQYACVSLGLDVRIIHTGADPVPLARRVKFFQLENHATLEVYSRETGTWVWIDPTGYVLAATVDGAPLTLLQIIEAIGTPLEDKIRVTTFDIKGKQRVTLPLAQSPAAGFMKNYFRPSVRLKF